MGFAAWKYLFDACKNECDSEPSKIGTMADSGLRGVRKKLMFMMISSALKCYGFSRPHSQQQIICNFQITS
jgi:hypothetical protein